MLKILPHIIFIALVVVVSVFSLGIVLTYKNVVCDTEQCFLPRASECLSTDYLNKIGGLYFVYRIRGCNLEKIVIDSEESEDVADLFLGKSVNCAYQKGNFSAEYIKKITGGFDTCEGDLKNILESA